MAVIAEIARIVLKTFPSNRINGAVERFLSTGAGIYRRGRGERRGDFGRRRSGKAAFSVSLRPPR